MHKGHERCGTCYFHDHDNNCCQQQPPIPVFYGMQRQPPGAVNSTPVVMGHYAPNGPDGWCGQWKAEKQVLAS
jgi:hypothetical protein